MDDRHRRPDWVDDDLFPFESHFLDLDGHTIHHVDEGTGPVLLMLHGNPTWSFLYRDMIPILSERFRCIALDYPGFGLSTAGDGYGFTAAEHADVVDAFIEELDLDGFTPVMQDWGGPIGIAATARHADRVRAMVLGNTWAWPNDSMQAKAFSGVLGGPVGQVLVERANFFARRLVPIGHRRRTLTPEELRHYTAPFPDAEARIPTHVFPREIVEARPFLVDTEAALSTLAHVPTLIAWGTADPVFPAAVRRRWERELSDHHTHLLHGAGHYIQDDAGYEMAKAVLDWWGQDGPDSA